MNVERNRHHTLLSGLFVAVLVTLCVTLGFLQYRWIGEASRAERERLHGSLHATLQRLSQEFNADITATSVALLPATQIEEAERERIYANRYAQWRESGRHNGLVRQVSLAIPERDSLRLRNLDPNTGAFVDAEWPVEWQPLRGRLMARLAGESPRGPQAGSFSESELSLIDLPRFGPPGGQFGRPREREWLIVQLDLDYVRSILLPELVQRHLGGGDKPDYQVEVVARNNPSTVIYQSGHDGGASVSANADASVGLFEVRYDQIMRRGGPPRGPSRGPTDEGRLLLSVRHRAGSLDAVVNQARWRNLAVTAAVLILMLAAIAALVLFTRRAHRLAELQMEFVAGVSHELRTPLSVIRTAAHNLGGGVISNVKQVQRYGSLIEQEAQKLTGIVEQVLMFSNAKAGRVIRVREAVSVGFLIVEALHACNKSIQESHCTVETKVDPELPPILGDSTALKHALQNLVSNAAKYGTEGGWIGIFASSAQDGMIEIRIADRGPGIPAGEMDHIFDAFYRGRKAVEDQIHGTGLGLSLVKRIIEAHEGTVTVNSEVRKGTEFVLRIPAAPAEQIDEFADSPSRG